MYMLRSLSHDTNKMLYECIYFVLSATYQVKAVKEQPQHISETTSEVSEQDVGETTCSCILSLVKSLMIFWHDIHILLS